MGNKNFWLKFTFATLLTIGLFVWVGKLGVAFWEGYRREKADILLSQSQNTENLKQKILLLSFADVLNPNDLTKVSLGKSYDEIGIKDQAAKNYLKVSNLDLLKNNPGLGAMATYNYYYQQGYPQVAKKIIYFYKNQLVTRDEYLVLTSEQIKDNDYQGAYTSLLSAREIDPFYPQIYQQLVYVCEKVDTKSCAGYQGYLRQITW